MLLYVFLAIHYCDFIKRMKVFTIIMSFLIDEHQKNYISASKTHFLSYYPLTLWTD